MTKTKSGNVRKHQKSSFLIKRTGNPSIFIVGHPDIHCWTLGYFDLLGLGVLGCSDLLGLGVPKETIRRRLFEGVALGT